MSDAEAAFVKLELQLQFLEAAMADTAFVVNHLVKDLHCSPDAGNHCSELQAAEHQLRTLLHHIRACAQQSIETEEQVRKGQRLYRELLHDFEAATRYFTEQATVLAALLPPAEQADVQVHLDVLRSFREDFSALD
jgi:glucose-6-phosphate-specific signal transduction histidine kinase